MNTIVTPVISFDDFVKLELKVGDILTAEEVEGSEKLIKFQIDLGEGSPRQILSGIKQWYKPEDMIGKQVVVASNLESRNIMGLESNGMILAVGEDEPVLIIPHKEVPLGSKVR